MIRFYIEKQQLVKMNAQMLGPCDRGLETTRFTFRNPRQSGRCGNLPLPTQIIKGMVKNNNKKINNLSRFIEKPKRIL